MLSLGDTQRTRRSAIQSQFRRRDRGRRVPVVFSGGPLDRVRTAVPAEADDSVYIGFCVVTDRDPAQILYTRGESADWRFAEFVSEAR